MDYTIDSFVFYSVLFSFVLFRRVFYSSLLSSFHFVFYSIRDYGLFCFVVCFIFVYSILLCYHVLSVDGDRDGYREDEFGACGEMIMEDHEGDV